MTKISLIENEIDLDKSELLYDFKNFKKDDWDIVRGDSDWIINDKAIRGIYKGPELHSQIFFNKAIKGDVVLEFDAKLLAPSEHDIIWLWKTSFEAEPWGEGYLGCLAGWYDDYLGIEKLPDYNARVLGRTYRLEPERVYHIISGTAKGHNFIILDGELVCFFTDPAAPSLDKEGYLGFGIYQSDAEYSNLKVYRPNLQPKKFGY